MILLGLVEIFGWDLLHANINTLVSFEVVGLHSQKINHTFEVLLQAHGDVHAHRILGQTIKDRSIRSLIVCPHTIELIDETKSWHILLISITPIGLTLRLHSGHSVKNYNCSVEDTQASLYFKVKSMCPGVSIMLNWCLKLVFPICPEPNEGLAYVGFQKQVIAAAVIVMPRSRSCSIQSVTVSPSWTSPILCDSPV